MNIRLHAPFSLKHSLECGQFFSYEKQGDWYFVTTHGRLFKIRQAAGFLEFEGADEAFIRTFFRLGDDLEQIRTTIARDDTMREALRKFWGLRLIRQEPWECLLSYIVSARNNIPAIRRSLKHLAVDFGTCVVLGGREAWALPSPEKVARAPPAKLREAGLGFRAKYVKETARIIADRRLDFDTLARQPYGEAREILTCLPGVGPKIADCVCLFGLGKLEAFPVDVWVKRAVQRAYFKGRTMSEEKVHTFGRKRWGEYAGYAQEYLYAWARSRRH